MNPYYQDDSVTLYGGDAPIKLDWTEHYATNGQITTPSGVIVEGA